MNYSEFIQNTLSNSVERLINAEAEVVSNLRWIIEQKEKVVTKKVQDKTYLASMLLVSNDWKAEGIDRDAEMKVVAIYSGVDKYNLVDSLKSTKDSYSSVTRISIVFMQNPNDILSSKKKLTESERKILKALKDYYNKKYYYPDNDKIMQLNRDLHALKHQFSVAYEATWSFALESILEDDFITRGLKCGTINILY